MRKVLAVSFAACMVVGYAADSSAHGQNCQRGIDPVVTTEWLAAHAADADLAVIDVRTPADYAVEHIPQAVSAPLSLWQTSRNGLSLELPDTNVLRATIGAAGISEETKVVVAGKTDTDDDKTAVARVAWTLIYGGVRNVAILDGGINKWKSEGKTLTAVPYAPLPVAYSGDFRECSLASKDDVAEHLTRAAIVDNRPVDEYFGITLHAVAKRLGHIQGAVCLPASFAYAADGTFRSVEDLRAMATGVVGDNTWHKVIVYCRGGKFAAAWWFILSEVLDYRFVKLYDGSVQEWSADANVPMVKFQW
jgi:thiosulfate/3-mercaptopyruvate sulfurtransferase